MKNEKDLIRYARQMEHLDRLYERIEKRKEHLRKRYDITEDEEKQIREAGYDRIKHRQ